MSKLVIIDGNAILHRAFHALPHTFTTPKGEPINAVYGMVSMLFRVITDLVPTHLVFTFDHKDPTFRNEMFEDYQAQRPKAHDDLISQFPKAYDVVEALDIPSFRVSGVEADDAIGTISKKADTEEIIVVTGDKDILQLINEKVKVYLPIRGLSNAELVGVRETKKRMGVGPSKIIDYKALVGDPSDNYKGVPGIGPKTAIGLLAKFKNLENIYNNIDKLPERVANALNEHKESAYVSQKLARIKTDVKLKFELDKARIDSMANSKALALFQEYGFRSLTKRLQKIDKLIQSSSQTSMF